MGDIAQFPGDETGGVGGPGKSVPGREYLCPLQFLPCYSGGLTCKLDFLVPLTPSTRADCSTEQRPHGGSARFCFWGGGVSDSGWSFGLILSLKGQLGLLGVSQVQHLHPFPQLPGGKDEGVNEEWGSPCWRGRRDGGC